MRPNGNFQLCTVLFLRTYHEFTRFWCVEKWERSFPWVTSNQHFWLFQKAGGTSKDGTQLQDSYTVISTMHVSLTSIASFSTSRAKETNAFKPIKVRSVPITISRSPTGISCRRDCPCPFQGIYFDCKQCYKLDLVLISFYTS